VIKPKSSCQDKDAERTLKRLVCSYVWTIGDTVEKEELKYMAKVGQDLLPPAVIRMVIQMCVREPLDDLRWNVESNPEMRDVLSAALSPNVAGMVKKRKELERKRDAYQNLLHHKFTCRDAHMVPASMETQDYWDAGTTTTPAGCGVRGSFMEGGKCRCMRSLTGQITGYGEGTCYANAASRFKEGKELVWSHQGKLLKCCAMGGKPDSTKIQDLNGEIPAVPTLLPTWNKKGCGAMFGNSYHNGPKQYKQCLVSVTHLEDVLGQTFEEIMELLDLEIEQ